MWFIIVPTSFPIAVSPVGSKENVDYSMKISGHRKCGSADGDQGLLVAQPEPETAPVGLLLDTELQTT